jgi:hypothetical protein
MADPRTDSQRGWAQRHHGASFSWSSLKSDPSNASSVDWHQDERQNVAEGAQKAAAAVQGPGPAKPRAQAPNTADWENHSFSLAIRYKTTSAWGVTNSNCTDWSRKCSSLQGAKNRAADACQRSYGQATPWKHSRKYPPQWTCSSSIQANGPSRSIDSTHASSSKGLRCGCAYFDD